MRELTLEIAKKALKSSIRYAEEICGEACSVAVVDEAGAVVIVHRMDDAGPATVDIAIAKAWTAVALKMPTLMMARTIDPRNKGKMLGEHGFGILTMNNCRLCCIPGGIPITGEGGEIIGGIGCSGIHVATGRISDTAVSQAGWAALYD